MAYRPEHSVFPHGAGADGVPWTTPFPTLDPADLKTAVLDADSTGTVIAAVTGKELRVYAVVMVCDAALDVNFRSGDSDDLEGAQTYAESGGRAESVTPPYYLFKTAAGESLDIV